MFRNLHKLSFVWQSYKNKKQQQQERGTKNKEIFQENKAKPGIQSVVSQSVNVRERDEYYMNAKTVLLSFTANKTTNSQ